MRRAVLLFEVTFAVLMVSIISLFILRGYGTFIKTAKKSSRYLKLINLSDRQMWNIQVKEIKGENFSEIPKEGKIDHIYSWKLRAEETQYEGIGKGILRFSDKDKKQLSFDIIFYFSPKER